MTLSRTSRCVIGVIAGCTAALGFSNLRDAVANGVPLNCLKDMMIVFDASGSMAQPDPMTGITSIDAARSAARRVLPTCRQNDAWD